MTDTEFPPHYFYHFCRTRRLTLSEQHLEQIEAKDFENADYLYYLDLSGNEIERIEANVFQNTPVLNIIVLSKNKIEFIDDQAFDYKKLLRLQLEGNKITALKWQPLDYVSYNFVWNNNSTYAIHTVDMTDWDNSFRLEASNNPFVISSEPIYMKTEQMVLRNNDLTWLPIYRKTKRLDAQNNRISRIVLEGSNVSIN